MNEENPDLYFAVGGYPIIGDLTFNQPDGATDIVAITHICKKDSDVYLKIVEEADVMEVEYNPDNPFIGYDERENKTDILRPKTAGLRIGKLEL